MASCSGTNSIKVGQNGALTVCINNENDTDQYSSENFVKYLEDLYNSFRLEILKEDGKINTPLAVLNDLAKKNLDQIHFESHEVRIQVNVTRFMVEIIVGHFHGFGEASRWKVAKQIAAADLLERLKASCPVETIPVYGLLPGIRIGISIFADLRDLCAAIKVPMPRYIELPRDPEDPIAPLYTYKCQIGQLIVQGYSDAETQARRWAAKKMFETLSGEKYPKDTIDYGSNCRVMERNGITPRVSNQKIQLMARMNEENGPAGRPKALAAISVKDERYYSDDEDEEIACLTNPTHRQAKTQNTVTKMEQTGRLSELRRQFDVFTLQ